MQVWTFRNFLVFARSFMPVAAAALFFSAVAAEASDLTIDGVIVQWSHELKRDHTFIAFIDTNGKAHLLEGNSSPRINGLAPKCTYLSVTSGVSDYPTPMAPWQLCESWPKDVILGRTLVRIAYRQNRMSDKAFYLGEPLEIKTEFKVSPYPANDEPAAFANAYAAESEACHSATEFIVHSKSRLYEAGVGTQDELAHSGINKIKQQVPPDEISRSVYYLAPCKSVVVQKFVLGANLIEMVLIDRRVVANSEYFKKNNMTTRLYFASQNADDAFSLSLGKRLLEDYIKLHSDSDATFAKHLIRLASSSYANAPDISPTQLSLKMSQESAKAAIKRMKLFDRATTESDEPDSVKGQVSIAGNIFDVYASSQQAGARVDTISLSTDGPGVPNPASPLNINFSYLTDPGAQRFIETVLGSDVYKDYYESVPFACPTAKDFRWSRGKLGGYQASRTVFIFTLDIEERCPAR